jgi:hypothetical protein
MTQLLRGLALLSLAAFPFGSRARQASEPAVTLGIDGKTNDNASIAARGRTVAVAFAATDANGTDIYLAFSRDGGATFGTPQRVNSTPGDARVSGEQPPRVALIDRKNGTPEIAVVWVTKTPAGARLLMSRSTDGGQTFSASAVVPGSDGVGNRGWESIAIDRRGRLFVMWLDHRESAKPGETGGEMKMEGMQHDPTAKAQLSKLYFAASDDKSPRIITAGVCYCCKTSLVATHDGAIYGAWRHVYAGSQRDIALAVSHDDGASFSTPARVSEDHWQFDGCPENGPALAVDGAKRIHVAWPTPPDGKTGTPLAMFYAMSKDGISFMPRVRLPSNGPAFHVQMTSTNTGAMTITWDEITTAGRVVRAVRARARDSGVPAFEGVPQLENVVGQYPVIASVPSGSVIAYTTTSKMGNRIAVLRVPR